MKKLIFFLTILICFSAIGQTNKSVIVTKSPETVPNGKKWVLEAGRKTRVELSYGVLNSGSLCNALFFSRPRMISHISSGDVSNSGEYLLLFEKPEEVPYTNKYTCDLTIVSIIHRDNILKLQYKHYDVIGVNKIEFKAGESVFVGNCLVNIELQEINMTKEELLEVKKK